MKSVIFFVLLGLSSAVLAAAGAHTTHIKAVIENPDATSQQNIPNVEIDLRQLKHHFQKFLKHEGDEGSLTFMQRFLMFIKENARELFIQLIDKIPFLKYLLTGEQNNIEGRIIGGVDALPYASVGKKFDRRYALQ